MAFPIGTIQRPNQISHSAGVISVANLLAKIGGQTHFLSLAQRLIATDVTLVANTRYQVFAVLVGGVPALRISINENSVGPAGFTAWDLVGSFYSNGVGSIAFGAFIKKLDDAPESESWDWTPTGAWTGNVGYSGKARRNKEFLEAEIYMVCSGAPSPNVQQSFNNPTNIATDPGKIPAGSSNFYHAGGWTGQDSGVNSRGGLVQLLGLIMYPYYFRGDTSTIDGVTLTTPFTWGNADAMTATVRVPVVGWNATPIKDL